MFTYPPAVRPMPRRRFTPATAGTEIALEDWPPVETIPVIGRPSVWTLESSLDCVTGFWIGSAFDKEPEAAVIVISEVGDFRGTVGRLEMPL